QNRSAPSVLVPAYIAQSAEYIATSTRPGYGAQNKTPTGRCRWGFIASRYGTRPLSAYGALGGESGSRGKLFGVNGISHLPLAMEFHICPWRSLGALFCSALNRKLGDEQPD
ncbi:hypothetical protein, partial [Nodosilinea sp. FACHB-13]|uniref:hypothetical protein n=1 Tax=Cyanophyceae TaxID=3028117 RepID=UPI001A7EEF1B